MSVFTNEVIVEQPIDVTVQNPGLTDAELRATPVPVSGTFFPATQPVSGTVAVTQSTSPWVISGTVSTSGSSVATATVTSVSVSPTVATLLVSDPARTRFVIFNEGGTLFVKAGAGASNADYTWRLTGNTSLEFSGYYGQVTATKASGTSNCQVTSF